MTIAFTPRDFWRRMLGITVAASVVTIGLISGYLMALLRLPNEQWWGFAQIVGVAFVVLFAITIRVNAMLFKGLLDYLAAVQVRQETPETLRTAYRSLSRIPTAMFLSGTGWWSVGGLLVASLMWARYESFQGFAFTIMTLAAATGGFVSSTFLYFVHKRIFAGLLTSLAKQIEDPIERRKLATRVPMRTKLVLPVAGVTLVTVTFVMFLAYVVSSRQLEASHARVQAGFLDQEVAAWNSHSPDTLSADATLRARKLSIARTVLLLDPDDSASLEAAAAVLFPEEVATILSGSTRGNGSRFLSPNVYSWKRRENEGVAMVAVMPWSELSGEGVVEWIFALMLLVSAAVSVGLSRVLARDVGDAAENLRAEIDRLSGGDLRIYQVHQSDDELGDLASSFEQMAGSLRTTVSLAASAADRVESVSTEIRGASKHVAQGAADQGTGVQEAARLMEGVGGQVAGVSTSAQSLNLLVEESSSSILEMGAAGDELSETARVLSTQVDEMSSSIEQMVHSVKEVAANTDDLSDFAAETSSSMEEMASAMRHVDTVAEQTESLSRRVVGAAETGREKVRQTIDGMESIRAATEVAETVIRNLGTRSVEIGAVLDVIDDVADETNLLALNAAIIAAQAGEHGKAFSVVADEIKELADRVLVSTKEIGGLIRAVQDESRSAVGAIEEGSRSVASGVELSMSAGTSLEEITSSSRESGSRMLEIVQAVREQTKAAGHVVELMERVRTGVEVIQRATGEQNRGNEMVFRSSVSMRDMSTQLRRTTEEQSRGGTRIRESIEGVRDAVESINGALQSQTSSNAELSTFLERVSASAADNSMAAQRVEESTQDLATEAESLREDLRKFQV